MSTLGKICKPSHKLLGLCIAAGLGMQASGGERPWQSAPQMQEITKLESMLRIHAMYGRPAPLSQYSRYYAAVMTKGRRMIIGELVIPFYGQKPGIFPVGREADFPGVMDGGCSVVHILYDVEAARVVEVACNGLA